MANINYLLNRNTKKYLRIHGTKEWKQRCLKKANYKCEVSGRKAVKSNKLDVHHKNISFDKIMRQAHDKLNIKYHKCILDYTKEDLEALVEEIKAIHKDSVEGIVLTHNLHMNLHGHYGKNPSEKDFKEFKRYHRTRQYKSINGSHKKAS